MIQPNGGVSSASTGGLRPLSDWCAKSMHAAWPPRLDRAGPFDARLQQSQRVNPSFECWTDPLYSGSVTGHRVLRIVGKGISMPSPASSPWCRAPLAPSIWPSARRREGPFLLPQNGPRLDRRTAHRWVQSMGKRAGLGLVHPHMLRAGFIMAALDAWVPLPDVQVAARRADPRTTTVYDRRRQHINRQAAFVLVAFVGGA
jgi:hypothetical protein